VTGGFDPEKGEEGRAAGLVTTTVCLTQSVHAPGLAPGYRRLSPMSARRSRRKRARQRSGKGGERRKSN